MDREDLTHGAEITGLGVLAAPEIAHAASLAKQTGLRAGLSSLHGKPGIELAGLGILAAPSIAHFGGKLLGKKPATPAQPKVAHAIPLEVLQAFAKEAKSRIGQGK